MIADEFRDASAVLEVIRELQQVTPRAVSLTSLQAQPGESVVLGGEATLYADVWGYLTLLQNSPLFRDVRMQYTATRKLGTAQVVEFKILCRLKASPDRKEDDGAS